MSHVICQVALEMNFMCGVILKQPHVQHGYYKKSVLCTNEDYGRVLKANVKLRKMLLPKILRLLLEWLSFMYK